MNKIIESDTSMRALGAQVGALLRGGETIVLTGDVGAGKTVFTKGLAMGLAVDEDIQSPTFTISRVYEGRDDIQLSHYDFYRLDNPGIMRDELAETMHDPLGVTVIEWAEVVDDIVPADALRVSIVPTSETSRQVSLEGPSALLDQLEQSS